MKVKIILYILYYIALIIDYIIKSLFYLKIYLF